MKKHFISGVWYRLLRILDLPVGLLIPALV